MWPCLLLKYCACNRVAVSCQSTAPATGLSVGPASSWPQKQGRKNDRETLTVASGLGTHKEKRYVLTFMFKLLGRKSACETFAGSNEILRWLTPFLGPNVDPKKWGPELDHMFIPSFRSLLGPFLVQIWTQKWDQPSENFCCCPQMFCKQNCDALA